MLYPILTLSDEYSTEITASKPDRNNEVKVFVEWVNNDDFENITFLISAEKKAYIIEQNTKDEVRMKRYLNLVEKMRADILDYISDKGKEVQYA